MQHPLAVVTPTLDGDVLAILARADAPFTAGSVQTLIGSRSYAGIRKVLDRLTQQGTVVSQRVGGVISYRLNRDHLAAPHIIALAGMRTTLLQRIRAHTDEWPTPPVWAALFGSAARGDMGPQSDIDIFLVDPATDPDRWESSVHDLSTEVTRWTGNDARVLSMTVAEVKAAAASGDPILQSLLDDALTLKGEPSWLRRTVMETRP